MVYKERKDFRIRSTGHMAEVPVALTILFILVLFPLINLIAVGMGMSAISLTTLQCVSRAAAQPNYASALTVLAQEATNSQSNGWMRFLNVKPIGGSQGCGMDLYIKSTDFKNGSNLSYGPNTALPPPVNSNECIYEYDAHACYQISPLISMTGVPFLAQIPGLGKPVTMAYDSARTVENLAGLTIGPSNGNSIHVASDTPPSINNYPGGIALEPPAAPGDWERPNLYQLIADSGQNIVDSSVFVVQANKGSLTPSGITVAAGQNLWFDFRADGTWCAGGTLGQTGPTGYTGLWWNSDVYDSHGNNLPDGCLAGNIGSMGYFEIGDQLTMPVYGGGALSCEMADSVNPTDFEDNSGEMVVRVVVTQS